MNNIDRRKTFVERLKYPLLFYREGFSEFSNTSRVVGHDVVHDIVLDHLKGFDPTSLCLESKCELVKVCTMIMFTCSVQHAAVNFLQWHYGCFAPISPSTMLGKIPKEKDRGKITKQDIIHALPDDWISARFASICHTLSDFSEDEVFLLHEKNKKNESTQNLKTDIQRCSTSELIATGILPPRWLFTEQSILKAYLKFRSSLIDIEKHIKRRNKGLRYPYEVLMPSKIPYSIAI